MNTHKLISCQLSRLVIALKLRASLLYGWAAVFGLFGALFSTPASSEVNFDLKLIVQAKVVASSDVHLAQTSGNLVEVATRHGGFDTWISAVQAAGLESTIANEGVFTIFAPTDAAFDSFDYRDFLLSPENRDLLIEVLRYGIISGEMYSSELETGQLESLTGGLSIQSDQTRIVVNDATIVQPDIKARNGVIHGINRVIMPASVREELENRWVQQQPPVNGWW